MDQRRADASGGVAVIPAIDPVEEQTYADQDSYRDKAQEPILLLRAVVAAGPHGGGNKDHHDMVEKAPHRDKAEERILIEIYVEHQPKYTAHQAKGTDSSASHLPEGVMPGKHRRREKEPEERAEVQGKCGGRIQDAEVPQFPQPIDGVKEEHQYSAGFQYTDHCAVWKESGSFVNTRCEQGSNK